jgi:hypothetical protein
LISNTKEQIVNRLAEYRIRALKELPKTVQLSSSPNSPSIETVIQANTRNPGYIANTLANWLPYEGKQSLVKGF